VTPSPTPADPERVAAQAAPERGRTPIWLAAIVPVVSLLILTGVRIARQPKLNFDENIFLDVGRHIVDTGLPWRTWAFPEPRLFFDHTPLYVYFVAAVTALGGPTVILLRSATLLFGCLTVLLVFRIGLELRGVGAALVGSMLVALNPFFATYSWFIRMEVPLCFFVVLALYLLIHERWLLSGVAIAIAVMLKEIAFAFWLVALVYAVWRGRWRAGAAVGIPALLAFAVWVGYAASIGYGQLVATMSRWFGSAAGTDLPDKRLRVGPLAWAKSIVGVVIGPLMIFAAGAAAALAATMRSRTPPIVAVPIAYVVIAVAASFVIRLKEPRFLIAVIPMSAVAIALLVDWDHAWAQFRRRT